MQMIFYSWQSDLPNSTNRGFIGDCLEKAIKELRAEGSLGVEPALDRDTQGVPGSPDIAETIFEKIDNCSMFVGDLSFINGRRDGAPCDCTRLTPNPNVVAEWGRATKSVGFERVVSVLNEATGSVNDLPFDLRKRLVLTYSLSKDEGKTQARKVLVGKLKSAIQEIMKIPQALVELQFADVETEEPIGKTAALEGLFIVPLDDIPTYAVGAQSTGRFAEAAFSIANSMKNGEYLREKAEYLTITRLIKPLRFVLKNDGTRLLKNVRLEAAVVFSPTDGVLFYEENQLPELPTRDSPAITAIASSAIRRFKPAISHPGDVDISHKGGRWRIHVSFGNVQAKASTVADKFFVGSALSRTINIDGHIFADELPAPVAISLEIDFVATQQQMTMDDLRNNLPEENNRDD